MKVVIKSDGMVVREKVVANKMHLEVQKKNRAQVIPSKKKYNRKRDKRAFEEHI